MKQKLTQEYLDLALSLNFTPLVVRCHSPPSFYLIECGIVKPIPQKLIPANCLVLNMPAGTFHDH